MQQNDGGQAIRQRPFTPLGQVRLSLLNPAVGSECLAGDSWTVKEKDQIHLDLPRDLSDRLCMPNPCRGGGDPGDEQTCYTDDIWDIRITDESDTILSLAHILSLGQAPFETT